MPKGRKKGAAPAGGDKKQAPVPAPAAPNPVPAMSGLNINPQRTPGAPVTVPISRPETAPASMTTAVGPPAAAAPAPAPGGGQAPPPGPPPITNNWIALPKEKDEFKLPLRKTDGKLGTTLGLRTNHFPLTITFRQDCYFHYDIKIQRVKRVNPAAAGTAVPGQAAPVAVAGAPTTSRLPKRVMQKIVKCLVRQLTQQMRTNGQDVGIASDFISNVYSTMELERIGLMGVFDMGTIGGQIDPDPHEVETGQFEYTLIRAPDIPTNEVAALINNMQGSPQATSGVMVELETLFNAVIKAMPTRPYLCIGRSLVEFPANDGFDLGGGLRAWKGETACTTPGWKFLMNLMPSFVTVKVGAKVLVALKELFDGQDASNVTEWENADVDKASEYMNSTKVRYTPIAGKELGCVVDRVSRQSVSEAKFDYGQPSRKISVFDYYKLAYNRTLLHPNGPVLVSRSKGNLIPAEICVIKAGQSVNRKLDGNQTTQMKNVAQMKPDRLEREINSRMRALNLVQNELFDKFGMQIDPNMLEINARVLPVPSIRYKKVPATPQDPYRDVAPDNGMWMIWQHRFQFQKLYNVKDMQGRETSNIKWAILGAGTGQLDPRGVAAFKKEMMTWGLKCGMNFLPDVDVSCTDRIFEENHIRNIQIFKEIFSKLKNKGINLVIVVIPRKPSRFYGQAKQAAELDVHGVGIMTQDILRANFAPTNPRRLQQIVQNLLLKINSKLGGVTHHVIPPPQVDNNKTSFMKEPTMILGADVLHPSPGTVIKGKDGKPIPLPSFAAVTASIGQSCMPTMMDIQAQAKVGSGALEVIKNLKQIVENMLLTFGHRNRRLPKKILYFRDGVGQGQFKELLHVEMRAIRDACSSFNKYNGGLPYEPKITFVTVQKRGKTRFFLPVENGATTNAPAGTVVDSHVVHPTEVDFYLQSHAAIQGTSHPTRYHLLHDDSDYTMDELQIMTYCMCHMYVRCNRSVKVPAATYYAHWGATRARDLAESSEHLYADMDKLNAAIKRNATFTTNYPMHFV